MKFQILQMFHMKLQSLLLVPYLLGFLDYLQVTAEKVDLSELFMPSYHCVSHNIFLQNQKWEWSRDQYMEAKKTAQT